MIRHTKSHAQLSMDAAVAGSRSYGQFVEGRNNRYVQVILKCQLIITVAATAILGIGSAAQIFDEIGIDENGKDMPANPMAWVAISEFLRASAGTAVRATSINTGTYNLVETIIIPFEYLFSARPRESLFRERNPSARLRVFFKLNGTNNGLAKLVQGGTATVGNVTATGVQFYDDDPTAHTPLFKPAWKEIFLPIPSASTGFLLYLDLNPDEVLRGMTILQNTANVNLVSDIINKIALRGARQDVIGRGDLVLYDDFARSQEFEAGGNVYATPNKMFVHYNFQKSGRLSQCLNSQQDTNFRLLFDAQPSVTLGATGSEIRVLLHLLRRDPYQRQDGTFVTAPKLPDLLVKA